MPLAAKRGRAHGPPRPASATARRPRAEPAEVEASARAMLRVRADIVDRLVQRGRRGRDRARARRRASCAR
jgi:hypothetical protein